MTNHYKKSHAITFGHGLEKFVMDQCLAADWCLRTTDI